MVGIYMYDGPEFFILDYNADIQQLVDIWWSHHLSAENVVNHSNVI